MEIKEECWDKKNCPCLLTQMTKHSQNFEFVAQEINSPLEL